MATRSGTFVSDEQWTEARRLFDEQVSARDDSTTLTKARYHTIMDLLKSWDDLTPTERKELSGGNHMYWRAKYAVAPGMTDDDCHLIYRDGNKRVVHKDNLFDAIKEVPVQSTHSRPALRMTYSSSSFVLLVVCAQSFIVEMCML